MHVSSQAGKIEKERKGGQGREEKEKTKLYTPRKILTIYRCLKNWDQSSKAVESESIVQFVKKSPKKLGYYVGTVILEDDSTTPAPL